jgi:hypothetical protein
MFFLLLEWITKLLYGQEAVDEARKLNSPRRRRRR